MDVYIIYAIIIPSVTCTWTCITEKECVYRVIPNHFNQSFYMPLSELDETWYVNSTCGFVKPEKVSRLVALWLPS